MGLMSTEIPYDLLVPFWIGEGSDFEWQDALIYMVMTDRFVNGNTSNDEPIVGASQVLTGRVEILLELLK